MIQVLLTVSTSFVLVAPMPSPNPGPFLDPTALTYAIVGPLETAGQIFEVVTLTVVSQVAESTVNAFKKPKRRIQQTHQKYQSNQRYHHY